MIFFRSTVHFSFLVSFSDYPVHSRLSCVCGTFCFCLYTSFVLSFCSVPSAQVLILFTFLAFFAGLYANIFGACVWPDGACLFELENPRKYLLKSWSIQDKFSNCLSSFWVHFKETYNKLSLVVRPNPCLWCQPIIECKSLHTFGLPGNIRVC